MFDLVQKFNVKRGDFERRDDFEHFTKTYFVFNEILIKTNSGLLLGQCLSFDRFFFFCLTSTRSRDYDVIISTKLFSKIGRFITPLILTC